MTYLASLDAARQARFRQRRKERLALAEDVANALEWMLREPRSAEQREWAHKVLAEWRGDLSQQQAVARAERQQPLDQHDDKND